MKTLVYVAPNSRRKSGGQSQEEKLKTGLKTDDLSLVTYSGFCDAEGGHCACGHPILYRFHTSHGVVGSECIKYFDGSQQNTMKQAEKYMKKKVSAEKKAAKEKAEVEKLAPECARLLAELKTLSRIPEHYENLYAGYAKGENKTPAHYRKAIVALKHFIDKEKQS